MDNFISILCASLNSVTLWAIVGSIVGLLAISVLFALGYNLISNIIQEVQLKRLGGTYEVYRKGKRVW